MIELWGRQLPNHASLAVTWKRYALAEDYINGFSVQNAAAEAEGRNPKKRQLL